MNLKLVSPLSQLYDTLSILAYPKTIALIVLSYTTFHNFKTFEFDLLLKIL